METRGNVAPGQQYFTAGLRAMGNLMDFTPGLNKLLPVNPGRQFYPPDVPIATGLGCLMCLGLGGSIVWGSLSGKGFVDTGTSMAGHFKSPKIEFRIQCSCPDRNSTCAKVGEALVVARRKGMGYWPHRWA